MCVYWTWLFPYGHQASWIAQLSCLTCLILFILPLSLSSHTIFSGTIWVRNIYYLIFRKSVRLMWYILNLVLERVHLTFSELTDFSEVARLKYRSEGQTELSNFPSHSPSRPNLNVSYPLRQAGILLLFSTSKRV